MKGSELYVLHHNPRNLQQKVTGKLTAEYP